MNDVSRHRHPLCKIDPAEHFGRQRFPAGITLHRCGVGILSVLSLFVSSFAVASDHADPIDPLNRQQQEGAITDLFVFPVLKDGSPAFPYDRPTGLPLHNPLADVMRGELSDEDRSQIESLVMILCVRRQLTDSGQLNLEPYTYKIHIDYNSAVELPESGEHDNKSMPKASVSPSEYVEHVHGSDKLSVVEAYARYGGKVLHPREIEEDLVIAFRLNDAGQLQNGFPKIERGENSAVDLDARSGIHDDPFIFPGFYGTNVVAMAIRLPIHVIPADRNELLIWATSWNASRQIDHVGRSLRTQNPRFDLLNTLHPRDHVAAIAREHNHPSLMRDIFLRLNFGSIFAYRAWDFVPDVMCYSIRHPVGFPNGRLLTDDVGAILAQHGDTLLFELSYQDNAYRWPRQTTNDGRTDGTENFNAQYPYLLAPSPSREQPASPLRLSRSSIVKLSGIGLGLLLFAALSHWLFARWYYRHKLRRRYL